MSGRLVIANGRHWRTGDAIDVEIGEGRIARVRAAAGAVQAGGAVARAGAPRDRGSEVVIDATGAVIAPGLVDAHVHLREPGQGAKETIATGTAAAAAGGFTDVACMPNTLPPLDSVAWIEWVRARARDAGHCRVHPIGAVTMGQAGEQLADLAALRRAGAVALSDDGRPVESAAMMRRALEAARPLGLPVIAHLEDLSLRGDGCMNEGAVATRLGLAGIPNAAESVMAWRDMELATLTSGRLHYAHLSCVESLAALAEAKRRGLAVTGEACPHHWMLTDAAVGDYDTNAKMNPPLRTARDRDAVLAAIANGVIDLLATDHAPHSDEDKRLPFGEAPFGIVGLETALALTLTGLVAPGHVSLVRAVELWTEAPRRLLGLPEVRLEAGFPADLVVFDPTAEWVVDPTAFRSKGRNTPFAGARLRGRVLVTVCGGAVTHVTSGVALAGSVAHAAGSTAATHAAATPEPAR